MGGMRGAGSEGEARQESAPPKPQPEQKSGGAVEDAVKEGVNILKGIFGK
jgi:hypothetical protein